MSDQYPDYVVDASHAFRNIMTAVSRPGRIIPFKSEHAAPAPFWANTVAIARTLCDFQTPVWLAPEFQNGAIPHYIRFHTGAPIAAMPADASFVFLQASATLAEPSLFSQGTHEYPDRSATLVIQTPGLSNTGEAELSGPGIPLPLKFHAEEVPRAFWLAMAENHCRFPLGVDVIFVSPDAIAALPRSTAILFQGTI